LPVNPSEILRRAEQGEVSQDLRDALENIREFLRPGISLEAYARAIRAAGAVSGVAEKLAHATPDDAEMGFVARVDFLRALLGKSENVAVWQSSTGTRRVLGSMYRELPYYQTSVPEKRGLRPRKVRVESPVRVDLGMGGLSDLPPWTNEQRGRAVSMCASISGVPPIRCTAEIVQTPGLTLIRDDDVSREHVESWEGLEIVGTQTSILRAAVRHMLGDSFRQASLEAAIDAVFGGGLLITVESSAPKGLGSSSIIAATITQALFRLLGFVPQWQDIVHRTVGIERMTGVGGGWEDALPPFFGGVVEAESTPARLPVLDARRLPLSTDFIRTLEARVVLFDTHLAAYTGDILAEGTLRYIAGDAATTAASHELLDICAHAADAIKSQDLALLARLSLEQWELWKRITHGACTTPQLDSLLAGGLRFAMGAKPNGAGAGGAVLFIVEDEKREALLEYLQDQPGQILDWSIDLTGYRIDEWYQAGAVRRYIEQRLPPMLEAASQFDRHGELIACQTSIMAAAPDDQEVGPLNHSIFDVIFDVALSVNAIAAAVAPMIGTAEPATLGSVKRLIDATAGTVFNDELQHWTREVSIATAEAKDEYGDAQPGVPGAGAIGRSRLRLAVDVVDGTTPAATGANGAYSICSVANGMRSFPDLQAYAILAPRGARQDLDLSSRPEDAVAGNLNAIARSRGKRVDELRIVCHSYDTGLHHTTLIERMRALGVDVVVPNPVIVEPPYVVAATQSRHLDGMIGVFGLPEIAINTVLAGVVAGDSEMVFRIASNEQLRERKATTLDGVFDFSPAERSTLQQFGLDSETIFDFDHIVADRGACFAGAALTYDDVLDIPGVLHEESITTIQSWLADPCGNLHRLRLRFRRPAQIDYSARYSQPLFDISLVAPLESAEAGLNVAERLEQLTRDLRHVVPGIYIQPRSDTRDGRVGLHVTLYEFVVQYLPAFQDETKREALLRRATEIVANVMSAIRAPLCFNILRVERRSAGIRAIVEPDAIVLDLADRIAAEAQKIADFIPKRLSGEYHVTLARFTEVAANPVTEAIDDLCAKFNAEPCPSVYLRQAWLRQAAATPFREIEKDIAFFIAD